MLNPSPNLEVFFAFCLKPDHEFRRKLGQDFLNINLGMVWENLGPERCGLIINPSGLVAMGPKKDKEKPRPLREG